MTLYEIDKRIEEAYYKSLNPETGEIVNDEAMAEYEQLKMEKPVKIENIAMFVKNLEADADIYEAKAKPFADEAKKFKDKAKSLRNKARWFKKYIQDSLNGEKFEGQNINISYLPSEVVKIEDVKAIPTQYLKYEPDIASIRVALKLKPDSVPGAILEEKQNIQIK